MTEKIIYVAEDGERFESREECLKHEAGIGPDKVLRHMELHIGGVLDSLSPKNVLKLRAYVESVSSSSYKVGYDVSHNEYRAEVYGDELNSKEIKEQMWVWDSCEEWYDDYE